MNQKKLRILGIRGIPAIHGGFETFAEHLAIYLRQKGWDVEVYCQVEGAGGSTTDSWDGITRINIPEPRLDALGTMRFDWKCIKHASQSKSLVLTLGYNTAIFGLFLKLKGIPHLMNMDGIEWKRKKWGVFARIWFYFNEWAGSLLADHLIADHPKIQERYSGRRKSSDVTMIPYGADDVTQADELLIKQYGLQANEYAVYIARPEPENSLFEVVTAFSKTSRGYPLIILSRMMPETNKFHKKVMSEASDEVQFLGAIHEREIVNALRYFSKYYIHGHTVGGTNPSLVEALGAGSPVLAHANEFNRWVAGEGAHYFNTAEELETMFDSFVTNQHQLESLRTMSKCRFLDSFTWDRILSEYERLLTKYLQS